MKNPYSAYQQTQDDNLGPMEVILELYKGLIRFLKEAKSAHAQGDLEKMMYWMDRAFKVVNALAANVDTDQGGKDAEFLNEFYVILMGRFAKILDRPDVQREFDQLVDYVTPVYERWYELTYKRPVPKGDTQEAHQNAASSQETQ